MVASRGVVVVLSAVVSLVAWKIFTLERCKFVRVMRESWANSSGGQVTSQEHAYKQAFNHRLALLSRLGKSIGKLISAWTREVGSSHLLLYSLFVSTLASSRGSLEKWRSSCRHDLCLAASARVVLIYHLNDAHHLSSRVFVLFSTFQIQIQFRSDSDSENESSLVRRLR